MVGMFMVGHEDGKGPQFGVVVEPMVAGGVDVPVLPLSPAVLVEVVVVVVVVVVVLVPVAVVVCFVTEIEDAGMKEGIGNVMLGNLGKSILIGLGLVVGVGAVGVLGLGLVVVSGLATGSRVLGVSSALGAGAGVAAARALALPILVLSICSLNPDPVAIQGTNCCKELAVLTCCCCGVQCHVRVK